MSPRLISLFATVLCPLAAVASAAYIDLDGPAHEYHQRSLRDRFTRIKGDLESGQLGLDTSSEKAFLTSLLARIQIPVSSQMLVFSNTSLQLRLISPRNPRALYFSDDVYVGWVPGGQIEVLSIDPELGGIFYIFAPPRNGQPVRAERSERCMNCHANEDTGHVPGLVIRSVVPGPTGGSLDAMRQQLTGHGIPFDQRFGGWHVTGQGGITDHWGNTVGKFDSGAITRIPVEPGQYFEFSRYPVATSDVLPQLIHEHQAGFVNRVVEAAYRARTILHSSQGKAAPEQLRELDDQARSLARYILFADEVPLPGGGIAGDPAFKTDFARTRRAAPDGRSLKDFDLRTRMFTHRCSYMIYTDVFRSLPAPMLERVYRRLGEALNPVKPDAEYAYLPATEKQAIRSILKATLPDLPRDW